MKFVIQFHIAAVQVQFGDNRSVPHQIFFKQHKVRDESSDRPSDLTLFVCNIPPYYNEVSYKIPNNISSCCLPTNFDVDLGMYETIIQVLWRR